MTMNNEQIIKILEDCRISWKDLPAFHRVDIKKMPKLLIAISDAKINDAIKNLKENNER